MSENPKTLGSKEMFRQSIVYLYNGYREDGLKATEAKEQVAKDIKEIYEEYAQEGSLPKRSFGISNPSKIIDEVTETIVGLKNEEALRNPGFKLRFDSALRNLKHLKHLVK